jgi:hypothetical protein
MIREANKFDIEGIIRMLKNYREAAPLDVLKYANDEEYIERMITEIIAGMGFVLVSEKDEQLTGMLDLRKDPKHMESKNASMQRGCILGRRRSPGRHRRI